MKATGESLQGWLDGAFSSTDGEGVYLAHQPIYGFRAGHCATQTMMRYLITYEILLALARLKFRTFVDIGGAEGYKSALVRHLFGAEVTSCDYSQAAVQRAEEIFQVPGRAVDVRDLPFADGAFEVVVCSETLEHIKEIKEATLELLRISSGAVIITVPQDPPERIARNLQNTEDPFPHIQSLTSTSFDWVRELGYQVQARVFNHHRLSLLFKLVEAREATKKKYSPLRKFLQNKVQNGILKVLFGKRTASLLFKLDHGLSGPGANGKNLIYVITKDPSVARETPDPGLEPNCVFEFKVPLHYL